MKSLFLVIIGILLCQLVYSQRNVAIVGTDRTTSNLTHMFRFEVVDSESKWPIFNARLKMINDGQLVFDIYTNQEGVGIVIFVTNNTNYNSFYGGDLSVIAQNYKPYKVSMEQIDYLNDGEWISLINKDRTQYIEDNMLSLETLIDCLEENRFDSKGGGIISYYEYHGFKIELKKIPEKINVNTQ